MKWRVNVLGAMVLSMRWIAPYAWFRVTIVLAQCSGRHQTIRKTVGSFKMMSLPRSLGMNG